MNSPTFSAEKIGNTVYLEQTGNKRAPLKLSWAIRKSLKKLPLKNGRWVYIDGELSLLAKANDADFVMTGRHRLHKAKMVKDLDYWKKKLLAALGGGLEKSLGSILYPEGVPDDVEDLLSKARGYPVGTIRKWGGKEYKKMSSGKWVRTYKEEASRGARQAIRNVMKKIMDAQSMEELVQIVKENQSRFQDENGKMLPVVKEFMAAARATGAGEKKAEPLGEIAEFDKWWLESTGKELQELSKKKADGYKREIKRLQKYMERNPLDPSNGMREETISSMESAIEREEAASQDVQKPSTFMSQAQLDYHMNEWKKETGQIPKEKTGEELGIQAMMQTIAKISEDTGRSSEEIQDLIADYKEKNPKAKITIKKAYEVVAAADPEPVPEPGAEDEKPTEAAEEYEKKEEVVENKNDVPMDKEPETGEKAQVTIETANPTNRQKKTLELGGTDKKAKDDEEVFENQGADKPFKPVPFERKMIVGRNAETGVIKGDDFTGIDGRQVLLTPMSEITKAGDNWHDIKPKWIPNFDLGDFRRNAHEIIFVEMEPGKYLVPVDQKYRPNGSSFYNPSTKDRAEYNSFEKTYLIMNLEQVAATQDFYRKVAKAKLKKAQDEKQAQWEASGFTSKIKRSRLQILSDRRMNYETSYLMKDFMNYGLQNVERATWAEYRRVQSDLKQKTIDMDLMREEVDNAFSKGRETSFGESNASDALMKDHGIKIKRQNGDDLTKEDQEYIQKAVDSVESVFGNRKSMNEKFGLKVSYAKGTHMHASKAVGLFVPMQHAIGISDGKGLQRKDPITGEPMEINYGDEKFGGFVLAHEYAHMMDYYLGKKNKKWYASDDKESTAGRIAATFRQNMNEESKSVYINRTCECFARALEQYHAIEASGEGAKAFYGAYVDSPQYVSSTVYKERIKPLVEQFLKENDEMLKSISDNITVEGA